MRPTIEDVEKQARDLWGKSAWIEVAHGKATARVRLGPAAMTVMMRSAFDKGAALADLSEAIQGERKVRAILASCKRRGAE